VRGHRGPRSCRRSVRARAGVVSIDVGAQILPSFALARADGHPTNQPPRMFYNWPGRCTQIRALSGFALENACV
jgi:hypothetical protein